MPTPRKQYSAAFKARVAMEALKGHKTMNELVSMYGVHATQITKWKTHLQSELPKIFSTRRDKHEQDHEALTAQLYQQIGQLKVEIDWLKKKSGLGD
jgi:transposase-like protein